MHAAWTLNLKFLFNRNEVDVPLQLKQALLGDDLGDGEGGAIVSRKHVLTEQTERASLQRSSLLKDEPEMIKIVRERLEILKGHLPLIDLRIENGSYTVMVPDTANDPLFKSRHGDSTHGGEGAHQRIATVQNSNPLSAMVSSLLRCILGGGDPKVPKKEKVIMGGVNLYFEPGKMYLVLYVVFRCPLDTERDNIKRHCLQTRCLRFLQGSSWIRKVDATENDCPEVEFAERIHCRYGFGCW